MPIEEPNHTKPDAAVTDRAGERAGADGAKELPAGGPAGNGKPDEGLRPDQLTSETDGGSQG